MYEWVIAKLIFQVEFHSFLEIANGPQAEEKPIILNLKVNSVAG